MSLNTISDQMERFHVNNENGWGVEITYTPRDTTNPPETVKAFSRAVSMDDKTTDEEHIVSKMDFLSVELANIPQRLDKILHNGINWYVESYANSASGLYDIYCYANKQSTNERTARMR